VADSWYDVRGSTAGRAAPSGDGKRPQALSAERVATQHPRQDSNLRPAV
jgi:hypothetical protein